MKLLFVVDQSDASVRIRIKLETQMLLNFFFLFSYLQLKILFYPALSCMGCCEYNLFSILTSILFVA